MNGWPNRFKKVRKAMGMNQVKMAELLRYNEKQIRRWENQETPIPHVIRSLVVLLERNQGEDLIQIAGILMENHDTIGDDGS